MNYYGNNSPVLDCDKEIEYWQKVYSGEIKEVAADFITHIHDPLALLPSEVVENNFWDSISKSIMDDLSTVEYDVLIESIDKNEPILEVKTIPLFNDFHNGSYGICKYLSTVQSSTYVEAGTHFTNEHNLIPARQKYGEEHLKLGAQLGFVALCKQSGSKTITGTITPLGLEFTKLSVSEFYQICPKLILRIPIIAALIKTANQSTVKIQNIMLELDMKESTIKRRTQSVKALLSVLKQTDSKLLNDRLTKIYW